MFILMGQCKTCKFSGLAPFSKQQNNRWWKMNIVYLSGHCLVCGRMPGRMLAWHSVCLDFVRGHCMQFTSFYFCFLFCAFQVRAFLQERISMSRVSAWCQPQVQAPAVIISLAASAVQKLCAILNFIKLYQVNPKSKVK